MCRMFPATMADWRQDGTERVRKGRVVAGGRNDLHGCTRCTWMGVGCRGRQGCWVRWYTGVWIPACAGMTEGGRDDGVPNALCNSPVGRTAHTCNEEERERVDAGSADRRVPYTNWVMAINADGSDTDRWSWPGWARWPLPAVGDDVHSWG